MTEPGDLELESDLTLSARVGQQLLGRLEIGDSDSIADDARELMELYSTQVFLGTEVNPALQVWVAEAFQRFLRNEVKTLDGAFNQRLRGRRLKMTPRAKRMIVEVYAEAMRVAISNRIVGREAEILGEHAAFLAFTGRTVEQATWPEGEGALADSLDRIRAVVKEFFRSN